MGNLKLNHRNSGSISRRSCRNYPHASRTYAIALEKMVTLAERFLLKPVAESQRFAIFAGVVQGGEEPKLISPSAATIGEMRIVERK